MLGDCAAASMLINSLCVSSHPTQLRVRGLERKAEEIVSTGLFLTEDAIWKLSNPYWGSYSLQALNSCGH